MAGRMRRARVGAGDARRRRGARRAGRGRWPGGLRPAAPGVRRGAGKEAVQQHAAVFAGQRSVADAAAPPPPAGRGTPRAAPASRRPPSRAPGRTAPRPAAAPRPAPPGTPRAPWRRTSVSGSSPAGSAASRSVRSGVSIGSASSAARAAARAPAASPSKHSTGHGEQPPQFLQLLFGQRGAERRDGAARSPAWCRAITSM